MKQYGKWKSHATEADMVRDASSLDQDGESMRQGDMAVGRIYFE